MAPPGRSDAPRTACCIELVEDIPTGHAAPLTLELSTTVDPPDDTDHGALPELAPLAFGAPLVRAELAEPSRAAPFADAAEHLTALLEMIAARAGLAIAERWHRGQLHGAAVAHHTGALELGALASAAGLPLDPLAGARAGLADQADVIAARVIASLGAGLELPVVELARELALSDLAIELLVAAAAPRARGELGRLYRTLGDAPDRPTCDDELLATLLAGDDARRRDQLRGELADDAALLRHGLVVRDPRGGLAVDDALLARLRGQPAPRSPATVQRDADRLLAELVVDRATLRTLVLELASPRDPDQPVRVVIRGRRGSGRHATIAALAARVDRRIACIDAGQLPGGPARPAALRRELARAVIGRALPVVSGLELHDGADPETTRQIAQVVRAHPGPLVVRTSADAAVPLEPGALDVTLPPLSEAERQRGFAAELERHAVAGNAELLAARHRVAPGTIARVVAEARRRLERSAGDPTAVVDAMIRQHVAARIAPIATQVTRLARWDQLALPDELLDRLRELIGRAQAAATVFDDWGFDPRRSTGRGLTALFHGPPGTGKALAASAIAGELGVELWRVDLARVMAASLGDPAQRLADVFDAAEDGRVMLLLDDADALFARRADHPAHPALHYLRQRLDAFDGVAILTTHDEAAIDPAFKRRLAMRLGFALPDEALRARLWASHITPKIPTAGRLDFAALARRFPLSGGDIRTSALRAAFLAAQDRSALTQAHLERAVLLAYRELDPG